jgi:hypothetical protein
MEAYRITLTPKDSINDVQKTLKSWSACIPSPLGARPSGARAHRETDDDLEMPRCPCL